MLISAGQAWIYRAPAGFEASRLIVGAIARFADREAIVCVAVTDALQRRPDGSIGRATIPFLPIGEGAFRASITALDGEAALPEAFAEGLAVWQDDARGLSCFTVPFEGSLDHMIARQMALIVGDADAA